MSAAGIEARAVDSTTVEVAGNRLRVVTTAHPTPAEVSDLGQSADLIVADRLSAAGVRVLTRSESGGRTGAGISDFPLPA